MSVKAITYIRMQNGIPFLILDCPKGFKELLDTIEEKKIEAKFVGEDNVQCRFIVSEGEIIGNKIRLNFPDAIERFQRRQDFRLEIFPGAKKQVMCNSAFCEMRVLNISSGGVFALQRKTIKTQPVYTVGQRIFDMEFIFPAVNEEKRVHIKKAMIIRMEKRHREDRYCYAFQFIDIEKSEKMALTEMIYKFQAEFLRKRVGKKV